MKTEEFLNGQDLFLISDEVGSMRRRENAKHGAAALDASSADSPANIYWNSM